MNYSKKIFTGLSFVIIGILLLLENFKVISFQWNYIFSLWPIVLVFVGVNIVLNYYQTKLSFVLKLVLFILCWLLIIFQGTYFSCFTSKNYENKFDYWKNPTSDTGNKNESNLKIERNDSTIKEQNLSINGGAMSYYFEGNTPDLIEVNASSNNKKRAFVLEQNSKDSISNITFKTRNFKSNQDEDFGFDHKTKAVFKLNEQQIWNIEVLTGASDFSMDLSKFKIKNFNFNGGVSNMYLRIGALLAKTSIEVDSGVAAIKIEVPNESGCEVISDGGLSFKDFPGFTKISNSKYQTSGFESAKNKVYINLNGGLSKFEIKRY